MFATMNRERGALAQAPSGTSAGRNLLNNPGMPATRFAENLFFQMIRLLDPRSRDRGPRPSGVEWCPTLRYPQVAVGCVGVLV